jgi:hypothetical protein
MISISTGSRQRHLNSLMRFTAQDTQRQVQRRGRNDELLGLIHEETAEFAFVAAGAA